MSLMRANPGSGVTVSVLSPGVAMSDAEKSRRYRDRVRGGPPRQELPIEHGTARAMRRHERAGEELCDACAEFRRQRNAENYAKRKAAAEAAAQKPKRSRKRSR